MKPFFSNCPFGCAYLLLSGVGIKWVLSPGGNRFIPWHMGVLTARGNYLNFRRDFPHEQNRFGAWWFQGRFRALHRSRWRTVLERRGPVHVLPAEIGVAVCLTGYLLLWVPWFLAWACYPIWFTFLGGVNAIRRRFRKRRVPIPRK